MDCSPPGSSVHGILQAIILEWFGISFSRGSSWPRDQTWVSCTAGRFFNAEILGKLGSSYMSLQIHSGCYFLSLPSLWILFYYIAKIYKNSSIPSESIWQYNILSKITTLILIVLICKILKRASSVQFSSVIQSCPTLCNPMNCSMPGLSVHHQLPESTQTHVHWGGDAIQPCHPLSSPSPPALNLSQHQGIFKWVSFCHQVAKVLEFQLQHQSFQWTPRTDLY